MESQMLAWGMAMDGARVDPPECGVDVPNPQGSIQEAQADRSVLQDAVQQRLAGLMLATPLDRHKPQGTAGKEKAQDRKAAKQLIQVAFAVHRARCRHRLPSLKAAGLRRGSGSSGPDPCRSGCGSHWRGAPNVRYSSMTWGGIQSHGPSINASQRLGIASAERPGVPLRFADTASRPDRYGSRYLSFPVMMNPRWPVSTSFTDENRRSTARTNALSWRTARSSVLSREDAHHAVARDTASRAAADQDRTICRSSPRPKPVVRGASIIEPPWIRPAQPVPSDVSTSPPVVRDYRLPDASVTGRRLGSTSRRQQWRSSSMPRNTIVSTTRPAALDAARRNDPTPECGIPPRSGNATMPIETVMEPRRRARHVQGRRAHVRKEAAQHYGERPKSRGETPRRDAPEGLWTGSTGGVPARSHGSFQAPSQGWRGQWRRTPRRFLSPGHRRGRRGLECLGRCCRPSPMRCGAQGRTVHPR